MTLKIESTHKRENSGSINLKVVLLSFFTSSVINVSVLQLRVHVLPGLQWSSQYSSQWVSGGVLLGNVQNSLFIANQHQHNITESRTKLGLRMPKEIR